MIEPTHLNVARQYWVRMAYIIGVAGNSGTGKTSFADLVTQLIPGAKHISLDDYHKYDREQRKVLKITPLNPKANDFDLMYKHISSIKRGESIVKPVYNHSTGKIIKNGERFTPSDVVVIEGLLPFYDPRIANLFDVKIFFDICKPLELHWKIVRDRTKRHYEKQFDLRQRDRDFKKYVLPQKNICDVTLHACSTGRGGRGIRATIIPQNWPFNVHAEYAPGKYSLELDGRGITLRGTFTQKVLSNMLPGIAENKIPARVNSFTAAQLLIIWNILLERGDLDEIAGSARRDR